VTLKKLISDVKTYCNKEFRAKSGAADYFTYEIIFDKCKINWVSDHVSENPIPKAILETQRLMEDIIRKI